MLYSTEFAVYSNAPHFGDDFADGGFLM